MTFEQDSKDFPSVEEGNVKGWAAFLQALGRVPDSGVQAMQDGGYIIDVQAGDIAAQGPVVRQERLGSNVIDLF